MNQVAVHRRHAPLADGGHRRERLPAAKELLRGGRAVAADDDALRAPLHDRLQRKPRVRERLRAGDALAARALDMRQATGSTDFMANIGFLQNVQANSRVTSLARVGQHLLPGITGVMTRGDTPEEAAEFVATLNTLMQDAEGATTRTAATSLSGQLRDFKPRRRADRERYEALESTTARLQFLQGNPALKEDWSKTPDGTEVDFLGFARTEGRFAQHFPAGGEPTPEILATRADRLANWRLLQELAGLR